MFEKLVPDARLTRLDISRTLLASTETVTIQPGQVQVIHTGTRTHEPLTLSFQGDVGKFDMCVLLTTALVAGQEVKAAVMNRGADPVAIEPGEWFLVACRLGVIQSLDAEA